MQNLEQFPAEIEVTITVEDFNNSGKNYQHGLCCPFATAIKRFFNLKDIVSVGAYDVSILVTFNSVKYHSVGVDIEKQNYPSINMFTYLDYCNLSENHTEKTVKLKRVF